MLLPLGEASTLRRVSSKRPRLQQNKELKYRMEIKREYGCEFLINN
jgi:hypothetical protein